MYTYYVHACTFTLHVHVHVAFHDVLCIAVVCLRVGVQSLSNVTFIFSSASSISLHVYVVYCGSTCIYMIVHKLRGSMHA